MCTYVFVYAHTFILIFLVIFVFSFTFVSLLFLTISPSFSSIARAFSLLDDDDDLNDNDVLMVDLIAPTTGAAPPKSSPILKLIPGTASVAQQPPPQGPKIQSQVLT